MNVWREPRILGVGIDRCSCWGPERTPSFSGRRWSLSSVSFVRPIAAAIFLALLASSSAYAGCWGSNPSGTRTCGRFRGRVSNETLTLCEDSPGDCAAEGYHPVQRAPSSRPAKSRRSAATPSGFETPEIVIPPPEPATAPIPSPETSDSTSSSLQTYLVLVFLSVIAILIALAATFIRKGLPGRCKYCGEQSSIVSWAHPSCRQQYLKAWSDMISEASKAAQGSTPLADLSNELNGIAVAGRVPLDQMREAKVQGFEVAVDQILNQSSVSPEQERHLLEFSKVGDLSRDELNIRGAWSRMVKGCVLSDVSSGNFKSRVSMDSSLPFNFQKGEVLIWIFPGSRYLADKTHKSYVGRSSGMSFRVAKGVYYRVGSFRGHPVETTTLDSIDAGALAITQKHLYFGGGRTSFRIAIAKIVTLVPYSNGFGLFRDRVNAKREVFIVDDPWFAHNLLARLSSD